MKLPSENPATAAFERGMKYRWVVIVAAVIAGAIAGGAELNPAMLVFLLVVGGILVLVTIGGEKLFQRAFGARLKRRLSYGTHPERVTAGLVAVAVIAVAASILTVAGGSSWVRMAAYLLAAVIIAVSIWSAGRSAG